MKSVAPKPRSGHCSDLFSSAYLELDILLHSLLLLIETDARAHACAV